MVSHKVVSDLISETSAKEFGFITLILEREDNRPVSGKIPSKAGEHTTQDFSRHNALAAFATRASLFANLC